eukprot:SAG11_NODE_5128_length_1657_cov_1.265083_1_plen_109_part_10
MPLSAAARAELPALAAACTGYVGADLNALLREAVLAALDGKGEGLQEGLLVELEHLHMAHRRVRPSVARSAWMGAAPPTGWDDIGGAKVESLSHSFAFNRRLLVVPVHR